MKQEVIPQFIPRLCFEKYRYEDVHKESLPEFCRLKYEDVENEYFGFTGKKTPLGELNDLIVQKDQMIQLMVNTKADRIQPLIKEYSSLIKKIRESAMIIGIHPNML